MKLKTVALALDHLLNALFNGRPGMTVSSRAQTARLQGKRWGCILCTFLDFIDTNHCEESLKGDMKRSKEVIEDLANSYNKDGKR